MAHTRRAGGQSRAGGKSGGGKGGEHDLRGVEEAVERGHLEIVEELLADGDDGVCDEGLDRASLALVRGLPTLVEHDNVGVRHLVVEVPPDVLLGVGRDEELVLADHVLEEPHEHALACALLRDEGDQHALVGGVDEHLREALEDEVVRGALVVDENGDVLEDGREVVRAVVQ